MKTFCALPFSHLFLSEEGTSFPCCYALETGAANRDSAGNPIQVRDESSLRAAWKAQDKLRKEMLEGKQPAACNRCFQLEANGLQSLREVSNKRFAEFLPELMAGAGSDGSAPMRFLSFDLRLGNHCNLRCQMCSPASSRKLMDDFKLLYPGSEGEFDRFANLDWHSDPRFLDLILRHAGELREIHFAGGEPFLIPEVSSFVQELSTSPRAGQIRLSFNTNGTLLPERLLNLFRKFEGVRLIVSLDGVGAVNDYIRYPSRFEKIDANLRELHRRREEWNLTYVFFNATVQVHNLFHLPELIAYVAKEFPGFAPFPILGTLHVPECLSIQVLPLEVKREASSRINHFIENSRGYWKEIEGRVPDPAGAARFESRLRGILQFLFEQDRGDLRTELERFTGVMERIRGQKLAVPGL